MEKKDKFNTLCGEYHKGVIALCTCTELFKLCTCNAEKRYREQTGNILFKEDDNLYVYVRVGKASIYAELHRYDFTQDLYVDEETI